MTLRNWPLIVTKLLEDDPNLVTGMGSDLQILTRGHTQEGSSWFGSIKMGQASKIRVIKTTTFWPWMV